jgi:two-component system response regulator HydG
MRGTVLVVDDDMEMCRLLEQRLGRRDYRIESCRSGEAALGLLKERRFDAVVADLNLGAGPGGLDGIGLCERVAANWPDLPVVVITAFGSLDTAIAAIRAGAYDFITKPFEVEALDVSLHRAIQYRALREEVKRLRGIEDGGERFGELLGASRPMRELRRMLARVCTSDANVLIYGETGTGKELVARALHRESERASGPFVALNCAAVPRELLESELFGHVRGAFTDARSDRRGLFEEADGGTLFLDEVGELPAEMQPKLLRALQERRVRPVGSAHERTFDARVVCATNRDLETEVEEGRFREDLFFRLDVLRVEVPPLRARGADVLLLAQRFLERFADRAGKCVTGLSTPAAERLLAYTWPGNVRELENCLERAVALAEHEQVIVEDLPERIRDYRAGDVLIASHDPTELVPLEAVERVYILRVLDAVGGNKTLAARILGLDRKTLYRKLERYGRVRSSARSV